eukprot:g37588.t1
MEMNWKLCSDTCPYQFSVQQLRHKLVWKSDKVMVLAFSCSDRLTVRSPDAAASGIQLLVQSSSALGERSARVWSIRREPPIHKLPNSDSPPAHWLLPLVNDRSSCPAP